ncbi:hypothetical protein HD806DRAFT_147973 [Xylariaceae sp. AK1471]|nr:hypothetical protein HD806DRAFT_147973 [Xylariaceae sp. AK1471]
MARINFSQPLVHQLPLRYLLIVPVLFSISAVLILAVHGDVNSPLLYSQCHARSRLPALSHIPILGAPACFLVSFFMYASASMRAVAQFGAILAFVGALLTVCRVEAARPCNHRSWTIRFPTLSWLVFNLVGGTLVWDLWILPAFLKRAKDIRVERVKDDALAGSQESRDVFEDEERLRVERSFISRAEVCAIPLAVAIGFVVPSVLMLVLKDAVSVIVWLFFPVWVAIVHWAVELAAIRVLKDNGPLYLESHSPSVTLVYAVPFAASLLTHALFIWNLFYHNDSREMTRMALKFIEIDFSFIAATVLYWVLVESGVVPAMLLIVMSVFLGPGAALCVTWLIREKAICEFAVLNEGGGVGPDEESDGDNSTIHEDTPLLN